MIVVSGVLDVNLESRAQLAGVLVEHGLKPTGTQLATTQPRRRQRPHLRQQRRDIQIRGAQQLQRPRRAAAFRERRALEHHRTGITARHPQVRGVGTRVHPGALAHRPAVPGWGLRLPALHRHHLTVDVETQRRDEPACELPHGEPMAHRQGAGADKALPARPQCQPFHRSPDGIGPVEHPHRLVPPGSLLQHVTQRGDEGIDAAAQVLQIDQQHIKGVHHGRGRAPHRAVQAEDRDLVHRIEVVRRLDHVVLLVATQAVLRAERRDELHIA